MADIDKPKIHTTFAALDAVEKPEPYVYATKANKRVTFPDVYDMEFEKAEEFLRDVESDQWNGAVLKKWLSEKDYAALRADRLTLRQLNTLVELVKAHYEGTLGDSGEGSASEG